VAAFPPTSTHVCHSTSGTWYAQVRPLQGTLADAGGSGRTALLLHATATRTATRRSLSGLIPGRAATRPSAGARSLPTQPRLHAGAPGGRPALQFERLALTHPEDGSRESPRTGSLPGADLLSVLVGSVPPRQEGRDDLPGLVLAGLTGTDMPSWFGWRREEVSAFKCWVELFWSMLVRLMIKAW
jgi:hypothetical protein